MTTEFLPPDRLEAAQARLEWLSVTNPSDDYFQLVTKNPVTLTVSPWEWSSDGSSARFYVRGQEASGATIAVLWDLLEFNDKTDILTGWLILYHESIHLQQFLNAVESERWFWIDEDQMEKRKEEYFTTLLVYEIEAYAKTCELAIEWGVPFLGGLHCSHLEDKAAFAESIQVIVERSIKDRNP